MDHRNSWLSLPLAALLLAGCSQPGETQIARGNVLASRQRLTEAVEAYRAAAEAAPKRSRPRELLGHVLFDMRDFAGARQAYQDALAKSPDSLEAQLGLARLDAEEGHLDDALIRVGALLQKQPDNLYARLSRATLALKRGTAGDISQAIEDTAFAMRIDEKNPSVLYARGSAFLAAHKPEKAAEAFQLLVARVPTSPLGYYGQARVSAARGDGTATLTLLREAKTRSPATWKSAEVLRDSSFEGLRQDPSFLSQVEVL